MCLSGVQHPSWLLQLSIALLLHVVCLLQEPPSLLVTDIQPQRHLLENAVHSNLHHTEGSSSIPATGQTLLTFSGEKMGVTAPP